MDGPVIGVVIGSALYVKTPQTILRSHTIAV